MPVRNKAHVLPYTLALLEQVDYPKNRMSILIRSDHNEDTTERILNIWSKKWQNLIAKSHGSEDVYHHLDIQIDGKAGIRHPGQDKSPVQWTQKRFEHIMKLREQGLAEARKAWADWVSIFCNTFDFRAEIHQALLSQFSLLFCFELTVTQDVRH